MLPFRHIKQTSKNVADTTFKLCHRYLMVHFMRMFTIDALKNTSHIYFSIRYNVVTIVVRVNSFNVGMMICQKRNVSAMYGIMGLQRYSNPQSFIT